MKAEGFSFSAKELKGLSQNLTKVSNEGNVFS